MNNTAQCSFCGTLCPLDQVTILHNAEESEEESEEYMCPKCGDRMFYELIVSKNANKH